MKIVVLDGFVVNYGLTGLPLGPEFDVTWYDVTPQQSILERCKGAFAVFVNRTPLDAEFFANCAGLRFAGTFGTGYNHLQLEAAKAAGVTVCNVPEYSTQAVAQHTMALLLDIACRISAQDRYVKSGKWVNMTDIPLCGDGSFELAGKTIGLIGYGSIGRAVAKLARAFGMEVLAYRRHPQPEAGVEFVPLSQLLSQSDVISLHCPLSHETQGMIDAEAIAQMKPGAILLNTARGAIWDAQAVAEALDSGRLFMAGVDVYETEPPSAAHPLTSHPRVIATPHVAWTSKETRERLLQISAENLLAYLKGTPQNVLV